MLSKVERLIDNLQQDSITRADLAGERLNEKEVKQLAYALFNNHSLERLTLGGVVVGCNLCDSGVSLLASAIATHERLKYLDLRNNKITDHGANLLFKALNKYTPLQFLDLRSNPISEDWVKFVNIDRRDFDIDLEIIFDCGVLNLSNSHRGAYEV